MIGSLVTACGPALVPPDRPSSTQTVQATRSPEASDGPRSTVIAAPGVTAGALRAAVDAEDIHSHLDALQQIADANGGNRTTGSPGFDASVEYVAGRLEAAGYRVERQPFAFDTASSVNLLADFVGADRSRVVMLGAHLDSVPDGRGINDNGSGVATALAIAEALHSFAAADATIRFAFWGAEEPGQRGSSAYVASLDARARSAVTAYVNLDIIGSPNFVRFVYLEPNAAPGSQAISDLLGAQLTANDLSWQPIDLSGKSDHAAFTDAGIATGGLFTGGTEPKTDAQADAFGGAAGAPADPCIHRACDTIERINIEVLHEMASAAAAALASLATR